MVVGVAQSVPEVVAAHLVWEEGPADTAAPAGQWAQLRAVVGSRQAHRAAGENTVVEELVPGRWVLVRREEEAASLVRQGVEVGPMMLQAAAELQRKDGAHWGDLKACRLLNKLWKEGAEAAGTGSWSDKDQWHAGDCTMAVLP